MNYRLPSAVLNGWTLALENAVSNGLLTDSVATQIAGDAGDNSIRLIDGQFVQGETLDQLVEEDRADWDKIVEDYRLED